MNAISAQIKVGVTAGLNLSNNSYSGNNETSVNNSKAGFQAGIVADWQ